MKKIILLLIIGSTVAAQANFLTDWFGEIFSTKMTKTSTGFVITPDRVKTEYTNRIIWGDGWSDHNNTNPARGVVVEAYGDGWKYSTVTDEDGVFIVPVKANSNFTIRCSNGDSWAVYDGVLSGVPKGTTKDDKS